MKLKLMSSIAATALLMSFGAANAQDEEEVVTPTNQENGVGNQENGEGSQFNIPLDNNFNSAQADNASTATDNDNNDAYVHGTGNATDDTASNTGSGAQANDNSSIDAAVGNDGNAQDNDNNSGQIATDASTINDNDDKGLALGLGGEAAQANDGDATVNDNDNNSGEMAYDGGTVNDNDNNEFDLNSGVQVSKGGEINDNGDNRDNDAQANGDNSTASDNDNNDASVGRDGTAQDDVATLTGDGNLANDGGSIFDLDIGDVQLNVTQLDGYVSGVGILAGGLPSEGEGGGDGGALAFTGAIGGNSIDGNRGLFITNNNTGIANMQSSQSINVGSVTVGQTPVQ